MKSLLNALQEGRLVELPDNQKTKALEYLAVLIEAIPDLGVDGGITETVLAREQLHNTGIGKGWACPHARTGKDGELVCAVGWSPTGIDYGGPDQQLVHLVVMYFVPDTQKNAYLKEISSLAKAIQTQGALQELSALGDLAEVRHGLLDAIHVALKSTGPEARARMIQLEVAHAAAESASVGLTSDLARSVVPLSILVVPGSKTIVLSQDRDLVQALESDEKLIAALSRDGRAEHQGVQVLVRNQTGYQPDRTIYECLAIRIAKAG
jgi:mannitol/fructose-specific phosphotransferase system IIA component (Ntr-type)